VSKRYSSNGFFICTVFLSQLQGEIRSFLSNHWPSVFPLEDSKILNDTNEFFTSTLLKKSDPDYSQQYQLKSINDMENDYGNNVIAWSKFFTEVLNLSDFPGTATVRIYDEIVLNRILNYLSSTE